jgi:hypothetical protein
VFAQLYTQKLSQGPARAKTFLLARVQCAAPPEVMVYINSTARRYKRANTCNFSNRAGKKAKAGKEKLTAG